MFEVQASDAAAVVVKVYSEPLHWKMEKEGFVYGLLQNHAIDVPAPVVLAADDSKAVLPHNYLVLTRLEGRLLYSILDQLDAAGYVGRRGVGEPYRTNRDYMPAQFERKRRQFDALGGERALSSRIAGLVVEREQVVAGCTHPVFCHDDWHEGNVLVVRDPQGWRVSGILDFENVVVGDPVLDLAKTYCYSRRRSEATLHALAEGYGALRPGWREALDVYVLYHWLELWDWCASLGDVSPLQGIADSMRWLCRAG